MSAPFLTTTLGYPRLGENRQYKRLLEEFWENPYDQKQFVRAIRALEAKQLEVQAQRDINLVCCGDFSPYDRVLDLAIALGCIPERFGNVSNAQEYFAMARGKKGVAACEMTKWFDTNYHYVVPELPSVFRLVLDPLHQNFFWGSKAVEQAVKPWILGPFTFLRLAKLRDQALADRLSELVELYQKMLSALSGHGVPLVQMDEPSIVTDMSDVEWQAFQRCYETLAQCEVPLCIQTYYGDVAKLWEQLLQLPVAALGVDLVYDQGRNLQAICQNPFPADKLLVAGVIDGRNVWRSDLTRKLQMVQQLSERVSPTRLLLSPSCSLIHLPETVRVERHLPEELHGGLCFAQERLEELVLLAQAARHGVGAVSEQWEQFQALRQRYLHWTKRHMPAVQNRVAQLKEADFSRPSAQERSSLQRKKLSLPLLPTTTIGSFPQTDDIRQARQWPVDKQDLFMKGEIARVVAIQEALGIDVLVHGEPERSDMVYFFGEKLPGCATLKHGWVQSYGSRCVRPPVIFGDVWREQSLTVEVSQFAQSLTPKPVKGMITGPVTILGWSFVREDVPKKQVAYQLALAIRDEVTALEQEAGLVIIQIDEPAFREGLPLKTAAQAEYLDWAVRAFRLASSGVDASTQIHTHMCYAEFADILPAIAALDADVISIEDARSHGEMVQILRTQSYPREIGPGLWDIHSPEVPSIESMAAKLRQTLRVIPADQIWVNPDCGLKTRKYAEVIASLKNMVEAARIVRAEL